MLDTRDTDGTADEGRWRWRLALLGTVTAALAALTAIWKPFWYDERFTEYAVNLSWQGLWELTLYEKDSVHLMYYALLKLISDATGASGHWLRAPSILAVGASCILTMTLARRLLNAKVALFVGLIFALLPSVSFYGAEARPAAIGMALCVANMLLFVRILDGTGSWPALSVYVILLVGATYINLFSALIVLVQVCFALACRRASARWGLMLLAWALSLMLTLPLGTLAWTQRAQVSFIEPSLLDPLRLLSLPFGVGDSWTRAVLAAFGLAIALRGAVVAWLNRRSLFEAWNFTAFGWLWACMPGLALILLSPWIAFFGNRYVFSSAAGFAMVVGLGFALVAHSEFRRWLTVAWLVLAVIGHIPLLSFDAGVGA